VDVVEGAVGHSFFVAHAGHRHCRLTVEGVHNRLAGVAGQGVARSRRWCARWGVRIPHKVLRGGIARPIRRSVDIVPHGGHVVRSGSYEILVCCVRAGVERASRERSVHSPIVLFVVLVPTFSPLLPGGRRGISVVSRLLFFGHLLAEGVLDDEVRGVGRVHERAGRHRRQRHGERARSKGGRGTGTNRTNEYG
jgi:hypothetical protein